MAGTVACVLAVIPWNVAVTNIPMRIRPGLSTSRRTFAVRIVGSTIGQNVADAAFQNAVRIGHQMNVRILAEMHLRHVVLIHVADDPDVRQVGNGERIRSR